MKLYHYCSLETLFSIVKNKTIWFSDLLDSNDDKEDILIFKLFFEYCNSKEKMKNCENNINILSLNESEFIKAKAQTHIYGICFTKKCDSILHWMMYGKSNGVCLEFDMKKLKEYFSKLKCLQKPAVFRRVHYVDSCNDCHLQKLFNDTLSKCNGLIPNCFEQLIDISPLYKDKGWSAEKEWRIIIRNFVEKGIFNKSLPKVTFDENECKLNYIFKNNKPVFHYEVPLDLSFISKIIIGPNTKIGVKELYFKLTTANNEFEINEDDIIPSSLSYKN